MWKILRVILAIITTFGLGVGVMWLGRDNADIGTWGVGVVFGAFCLLFILFFAGFAVPKINMFGLAVAVGVVYVIPFDKGTPIGMTFGGLIGIALLATLLNWAVGAKKPPAPAEEPSEPVHKES